MDREEFIQAYIANQLSDEEKERAEELLKTDPEFREVLQAHQELATAFRLSNEKALKKELQILDDTLSAVNESSKEAKEKDTFKIFRRVAIAAVFVIGVFFAVNQFSSDGDLFETYFEVCPNTYMPVTRGTTPNGMTFEAFIAYESANFAQAETIFKTILDDENDSSIRFYYAMSLLNQEKSELALSELNSLTTITFDYQVESLWYAALIHLKKDNIQTAKAELQQLKTLNPNYKPEVIQNILQELP